MSLTCPQCDETFESTDELESEDLPEVSADDDGSISVYGSKRTFYRCRQCRKALGVGHS